MRKYGDENPYSSTWQNIFCSEKNCFGYCQRVRESKTMILLFWILIWCVFCIVTHTPVVIVITGGLLIGVIVALLEDEIVEK